MRRSILSFSYWRGGRDAHDSSAAIVCDGELVAAAEEERFTRRKHDAAFPIHAIEFCLRRAGLRMSEVDALAFPEKPFRSGRDSNLAGMDLAFLREARAAGKAGLRRVVHKRLLDAYLRVGPAFNVLMDPDFADGFALLRAHYADLPPVSYYDHHRCHAAASYVSSGWDRAAIATVDNVGGPYASVAWRAEEGRIERLRAEPHYNSLGAFYFDCTAYLGFGDFGEGRTMGLAAYGDPERYRARLASILDVEGPGWYSYRERPAEALVGFPPRDGGPVLQAPFTDFAAAAQSSLQRALERLARWTTDRAGSPELCLGGGVSFNCSANGALLGSGAATSIWVFPAAGDAGLCVGAALLHAALAGERPRARLDRAYWGPEFGAAEQEAALVRESRVLFRRVHDPAAEAAGLLAEGKVIGWFQGRMELGPRALGNRSILADPRTVAMRDRVNRIKGREQWRPLAPAVLAEYASEYFCLEAESPFMLFAAPVRPERRSRIPAVVHVDGSARPQTVTRAQNPALYDLLAAFGRKTGVPVLLNTSFNAAGEPIVCTPEDAIRTFLATGLDVLVLGDYVVSRRQEGTDPGSAPPGVPRVREP